MWKDLWHREVHHSTAIEGNTLALKEVATLRQRPFEFRRECANRSVGQAAARRGFRGRGNATEFEEARPHAATRSRSKCFRWLPKA